MSKNDELKNEVKGVIEDLEDDDLQREVDHIRMKDPMQGLRDSIINFLETRLQVIDEEEQFRSVIKNAILSKVQNDSVSVPQLIQLLQTVDKDTVQSVESILSLLRPGNNGETSPIFHQNSGRQSDEMPSGFENLTPEQSELLDKLDRWIRSMESKEDGKSE